ncbi:hypothetical protein V6N12_073738 [Hibiscus sabdariffa]|uniref:RNase H type-1 domain-containing protein n=1 Tax=Hibiscus sabdariffa TaxID=183260 RepID=A0ABR2CTB0_9ROSI
MCPHIASSFVVEAQAAVYGLQLALELTFHHVILEDDSLAITSKPKLKKDDLSEISAFIWEAKHLSRSFASCWLQFTHEKEFMLHMQWLEDGPILLPTLFGLMKHLSI